MRDRERKTRNNNNNVITADLEMSSSGPDVFFWQISTKYQLWEEKKTNQFVFYCVSKMLEKGAASVVFYSVVEGRGGLIISFHNGWERCHKPAKRKFQLLLKSPLETMFTQKNWIFNQCVLSFAQTSVFRVKASNLEKPLILFPFSVAHNIHLNILLSWQINTDSD